MTSDNQLFFTSWKFLWDSILGLYRVARLTQEKVSLRIFVRKKGMSHVPLNGRAQQTPSASSERRKRACSAATTRFHDCLAFEKPKRSVPENMGAHVRCTSVQKVVSSNLAKTLKVATKIRETCEKTSFTPSSSLKATKLYRFCLSDKRSPNRQSTFSDCKKCSRTLSDCSSPSRQHIKRYNTTEIAFAFKR